MDPGSFLGKGNIGELVRDGLDDVVVFEYPATAAAAPG